MSLDAERDTSFAAIAGLSRRDGQFEIVKRLEEDIIFGRLTPGSRLVEDTLMSRYGGTRHTIRQALLHLERAGIITLEKNVGATVRSYSPDEVRQIYEVREMLTRQAILMMPLPAPEALIRDLSRLQAVYCRLEAGDLMGLHEVNDTFHLTLFAACGNRYLVKMLNDYMGLTLPVRAKNLADSGGLDLSRRQHRYMIELLSGRDSWAFAQLCVEHLQFSKADYLKRLPPQGAAAGGAGLNAP